MTLKEAAATLGLSESTLKHGFPRTQRNLKKKGILLMKWGYGKQAEFEIEYTKLDELELMEDEE